MSEHASLTPGRRLTREKRTIRAMLQIFCSAHHQTDGKALCNDCARLLDYAGRRLDSCPFGEAKPACNHCRVHCYAAGKRQQVKHVMRYAGPRMMTRHPYLSLMHLLDKLRKAPALDKSKGSRKGHRRT